MDEEELCEFVTLCNKRGLHARAAARFVESAHKFDAEIFVTLEETRVAGNSIMGLMMLAASQGAEIKISASGKDALLAIEALSALVRRGFDE